MLAPADISWNTLFLKNEENCFKNEWILDVDFFFCVN